MNSLNRKVVLGLLVIASTVFMSGHVMAQASQCGEKRDKSPGTLDEPTYKNLNKIYELVGEELYDEAFERINIMVKRARGDYLKATLAQMLAQVEWARENYVPALAQFELAVELDALPDHIHFSLMYQIAQLYYMQDRYDEALDSLALWMCKVTPEKIKPNAFMLRASIYAQKKDWKNVIPAVDDAIAKAVELTEAPKESWYQLKLAAHFELEQFPDAAKVLEVMIQSWPNKKDYWVRLSQIYYMLKKDDEALAVIALAHRRGMLDKQTDIMYLSNMYSDREVPFKAAETLEKGINDEIVEADSKNWTMVADAWYAAEELEKALNAYQKAGVASTNGEIDLRRGYILVDQERWDLAIEALEAALEKGGINDRKSGEAYVLLGMSYFSVENWSKASTAWGRATKYKKSRKAAQQWMNHMKDERARKLAIN